MPAADLGDEVLRAVAEGKNWATGEPIGPVYAESGDVVLVRGENAMTFMGALAAALLETRAALRKVATIAYDRGLCAGEHRAFLSAKDHQVHVRAAMDASGASACLPPGATT